MNIASIRAFNFYSFCVCAVLLSASAYFQFVQGLEPCPLCIVQRVIVVILAVSFLFGALFRGSKPIWVKFHNVFVFLIAGLGAAVAGRQVYLQHLPPEQVPACGPGWDYLLSHFSSIEAFKQILRGSGECAEVQWVFLGHSMPEWLLGLFLVFVLLSLINMKRA